MRNLTLAAALSLALALSGARALAQSTFKTPSGNAALNPASDPARVYIGVIWYDTDLPPSMGGDGQPAWPSSCVADDTEPKAGESSRLIGDVAGVPIGGH